jgi:hypothetical protein
VCGDSFDNLDDEVEARNTSESSLTQEIEMFELKKYWIKSSQSAIYHLPLTM